MNEKILHILEIIIILLMMIGAIIFKFIPEYKKSQGSSDSYIDTNIYQDIIELKINNKPNFAIVTDKTKILNILFYDQESTCLYNKNIENTNVSDGIKQIVTLLIENNYIKQDCSITITKYQGPTYNQVIMALTKELSDLGINVTIIENEKTLQQKAKDLNITETDDSAILKQLEFYSKNIIRRIKNDVSSNPYTPSINEQQIDDDTSRDYTDTVYKKIEVYAKKNNIFNQEIDNQTLPINLIPANKEGTLYPDESSWYYIKEGEVYAYISITTENKNYSYCYQASIDDYKKGQC